MSSTRRPGGLSAPARAARRADVERAVLAADEAFVAWKRDEDARRKAMPAAADAVDAATAELAALVTAEQGKPLNDAAMEVEQVALWLRYYADMEQPVEVVRDDDTGY